MPKQIRDDHDDTAFSGYDCSKSQGSVGVSPTSSPKPCGRDAHAPLPHVQNLPVLH